MLAINIIDVIINNNVKVNMEQSYVHKTYTEQIDPYPSNTENLPIFELLYYTIIAVADLVPRNSVTNNWQRPKQFNSIEYKNIK